MSGLNYAQILVDRKYNKNYTPQLDTPILTIENKPIGNKQSFVCIQGLPKAGKSSFLTSVISSAYIGEIFGIKLNAGRIGYFDTEQSQTDFYKFVDRIKYQINRSIPDNLDLFNCREDSASDIIKLIDQYCNDYKPECILIDGVLDIVHDFNNVVECNNVIQWLKKITKIYDMLIICVLHLGKKDKLSLGHLGSFLDRKSQSVLIVEKNKDTITLSGQYLRSTDGFTPVNIMYQNGNFVKVNQTNNDTNNIYGLELDALLRLLFIEPIDYNTLVNTLSERLGKGSTTVKKIVKQWINDNLIYKSGNVYKRR
jgi:hypothetical protein